MKKITLLGILSFILSIQTLFGQKDTTKIEIDKKIVRNIINKEFSRIAVGENSSSLNSYLDYNIADNKLAFNGVVPLGKSKDTINTYLSIKATGAIDDNKVFTALSNSKLNTNIALEFKLQNLRQCDWRVSFYQDKFAIYSRKKSEIDRIFESKKDSMVYNYQNIKDKYVQNVREFKELTKKKKELTAARMAKENYLRLIDSYWVHEEAINFYKKRLPSGYETKKDLSEVERQYSGLLNNEIRNKDSVELGLKKIIEQKIISGLSLSNFLAFTVPFDSTLIIDSLLVVYSSNLSKYQVGEDELGKFTDEKNHKTLHVILAELEKAKEEKINDLKSTFTSEEIKIKWWDISLGVSKSKFYLFNPILSFESQLTEKVTPSFRFTFGGNYFNKNFNSGSSLSRLSASFFWKDNKDDLIQKEVLESEKFAQLPKERVVNRKYNAFVGDYEINRMGVEFTYDFYKIINSDRNFGLHFFPTTSFKKNKNKTNLGIGIFWNFINKKETKSNLNVEFFGRIIDAFDNKESIYIDRIEAGISLNVPIILLKQ